MADDEMWMSTTFDVPGYSIDRNVGLCWGIFVRSVGIGKGITGGFHALKAGEVPQYNDSVSQAREGAVQRLMDHARSKGANAVLGVRFDSATIGQDADIAELIAYGTGVVISQQQ